MATLEHVSTNLRFTLSAGTDSAGDAVTKSVTVGKIASNVTAAAISDLSEKFGALLEYSVSAVKKNDVYLLSETE